MGQFSVYANRNAKSKARYPLLLDVQSQLLDSLQTRLVVPLAPASQYKGKAMTTLRPSFELDQESYVMLTPQMAGIARTEMGVEVADLSHHRQSIISAIDFLIAGV